MNEALIKKRFGVAALLLIAILLTAGSVVAFLVTTFRYTSTITEPLTFEKIGGLDITDPGDSDTIMVHATNNSTEIGYGIFVNNTVNDRVESVTYRGRLNLVASEPASDNDFNGDGDMVDAKYNIDPDEWFYIYVDIDTADNAAPGEVTVTLNFYRTSQYPQQ